MTAENWSDGWKTSPGVTFSTTNLTWTDLGSNSGFRGERPVTDRLSQGKVSGDRCVWLSPLTAMTLNDTRSTATTVFPFWAFMACTGVQPLAPELFFLNFSTPCIQNVNNTGTKQASIMKQTAFWRGKNGEYRACLKYSVPTFVEYIKCNVWRLAVRYDSYIGR